MNSLTRTFIVLCRLIGAVFGACDADNVNGIDGAAYLFVEGAYGGSLGDCGCGGRTVCARKCCAENYLIKDGLCSRNGSVDFDATVYEMRRRLDDDDFDFLTIFGMVTCADHKMLYDLPTNDALNDTSLLQADSRLWIPEYNVHADLEDYCMENVEGSGVRSLVCLTEYLSEGAPSKINTIGLTISMVFLFLTFAAYAVMPEKNLYAKCMMTYVSVLFGAYLTLVVLQNDVNLRQGTCVFLGLLCMFLFMVSFFWMNTISFDMWRTFSGMENRTADNADFERRRFKKYSAYAWGVPLVHLTLVTTLTFTLERGTWYNPDVGNGQCWLKMGYPSLLYFFGPLGVIVAVNVIFYSRTAWNIHVTQKDVRAQQTDNRRAEDVQRYKLYCKLFVAMGVNWSLEVVSWYVLWQHGKMHFYVLHVTDFANAMYGVFIFFSFVFKKKTWVMLKSRFNAIPFGFIRRRVLPVNVDVDLGNRRA